MAATAPSPPAAAPPGATPLVVAGLASLGAGAVHAAAVGVHSEPRSTAIAFAAVAVAQLGWGALALVRGGRRVAALGVLLAGAALVGWLLAKTTGIGLVDGLGESESIQLADGVAALLAAVALAASLREAVVPGTAGPARRTPSPAVLHGVAVVAVVALAGTAMVSAGSHSHAGGGHGHDEAAAGHDHGAGDDHGGEEHDDDHGDDDHAGHEPAAVPARPYDPTLPIDFGGVEGVTPEQQAAAENLVAITLVRLPQFADAEAAEAAGWHSIGDGFTGHEHLINWDLLDDGRELDPDFPESLVYDTSGGGRELVSAMFMAEPGTTLDSVPEVGGPLTQWHVHDDLCFTAGDAPRVSGVTSVGGECPPPSQKLEPRPMIHVWITPHVCGPFAALEGVAAGQVKEGEEHLCNHEHGAGS